MNKLFAIGLCACASSAVAAPSVPAPPDIQTFSSQVVQRKHALPGSWLKGAGENAFMKSPAHVVTTPDASMDPVSYWGSLFTPEGEEWLYTADFGFSETPTGAECISSAHFSIYDANFKPYKEFTAHFELGENETGINTVQMAPTLTKKFFNINDDYEVMIMVHATTADYAGHIYTQVYTLKDGTLVTTIEGNNIDAVNNAADSWSENFTMVFMREDISFGEDDDISYSIFFDIYGKAGWGTGCQLRHTFDVDYELVSGAGNYAMPILINKNKDKLYYALPHYEKPYFESAWSEDVTPDNNFIIDLYDNDFNLIKTTTIPMALEGDAIFSFPGMGELFGNADLSFGLFSDSELPVYIVGVENYIAASDDFTTSLYVYDTDGNKIKTIAKDAADYMQLSRIPGQPAQFCFYYPAADLGFFSLVDIPSCAEVAYIPLRFGEGEDAANITTSFDRVPSGNSYKYVSSLARAETNDAGDALHKFAWFNADGSFDRFDTVNLGQNIALALPNVTSQALNPYLFNTDSSMEYMFLVKEYANPGISTATDEKFRIYGANNELILEMGPRKDSGEVLNSIFLMNTETSDPKLVVSYYSYIQQTYTITRINLPLTKLNGGGTAANPYIVSTPGDLMAMYLYPSSHFVLANDIDFGSNPWDGTKCDFYGTLDGAGHTVSNLNLLGSGIFEGLYGAATIKDINFKDVTIQASGTCGVIANTSIGEGARSPKIVNVHISGLLAEGNAEVFGGIIGQGAGHTLISQCAVEGAISMPHASVGGLVGRMSTGSTVEASLFNGTINDASVAAGICGEAITGDETVTNCHVKADISASNLAAGIIAESNRAFVSYCYVEGSVVATGSRQAYAGGIVAYLSSTFEPVEAPIVFGNVVAATVSTNAGAEKHIAHRIAGFTSGDEMQVNWDSKDPSIDWSDPSTYPYYKGDPEKGFADNYALSEKIDDETADAADSAEGLTLTAGELTKDFLETLGWKFGTSVAEPWKYVGSPVELWFEDSLTGVTGIVADRNALSVERGVIKADGEIVIYSLSGVEVARGHNEISTDMLSRGSVYIATCGKRTMKFIAR